MTTLNSFNLGFLPGRLATLADSLLREVDTSCASTNASDPTTVRAWTPVVDIVEGADSYRIHVDLPDVAPADVKVVVRENVLTLKGERKAAALTDGEKAYLSERPTGHFQRSFNLPKNTNGENVAASFKNGTLLITIPKKEEVKPREIEVTLTA
jgi:HSP20 family protein